MRPLVLSLVAALVLAVLWGGSRPDDDPSATPTTDTVSPDCFVSFAEPERLSARLALQHGRRVRRLHPAGAFRDGSVSALLTLRRPAARRLEAGLSARGLHAFVTVLRDGDVSLAVRHRSAVLAEHPLSFVARPGRQLGLRLRIDGGTVKAKAWPVGARRPGWQAVATTSEVTADAGRAAVWGRLVTGRRASLRFDDVRVAVTRRSGALGVYTGMFENELARDYFGAYPAVSSSYYQPAEAVNVQRETERILQGISPSITITTKGTDTLEILGTGPSHPRYAEAEQWLDRYVAGLAAIASLDPDVPVHATVEHEFKMKVATGQLTGLSADPAYYGRALRLFYAKARAADPAIRVAYWIVADNHDRRIDRAAGRLLTTPPDTIVFDPYLSREGGTVPTLTDADLTWIKAQPWYVGQEIALGEFGAPVRFGDAELARFFTDLQPSLRAQGISWAVLFNRSRDLDTQIAGRVDGQAFPGAVDAFRASMAASAAC